MTAPPFGYHDIIDRALTALPEFRDSYEKEAKRWTEEPMGPYNVFDIILMPRVVELLKSHGDEDLLRRTFAFIETLLAHPKQEVRDVAAVGACEELCADELVLQKACRLMGPKTKECCDSYLK
ncbi:MAG: hypothetical protein WC943_04090 [Elusimicrobiota bacterium]|jgi:hypothetical protein